MGSALNQHTTSSHLPIAQNVWLTILAANFWGRRLSRISWFCGYSRKFSPWNLGVWYPLAWHEWAICKNRIFYQFTKVFSLESFLLYGSNHSHSASPSSLLTSHPAFLLHPFSTPPPFLPSPLLPPPLFLPTSFFSSPSLSPSTTYAFSQTRSHQLTLHNDSYSGGGRIVAIIMNSTGVISTGAPQDVSELQHKLHVHSATHYWPIWCPPVELCHREWGNMVACESKIISLINRCHTCAIYTWRL